MRCEMGYWLPCWQRFALRILSSSGEAIKRDFLLFAQASLISDGKPISLFFYLVSGILLKSMRSKGKGELRAYGFCNLNKKKLKTCFGDKNPNPDESDRWA